MRERLCFQGATILVEVNRDLQRDGDEYLVSRPDSRASNGVEVRH